MPTMADPFARRGRRLFADRQVALGPGGPSLGLMLAPAALGYSINTVTPPDTRNTIPSRVNGSDSVTSFNNPNKALYPSATSTERDTWRNRLCYRTYCNFMMDFGRDKQAASRYTPLSKSAADCPTHTETVEGRSFTFSPREQPAHGLRRALIAAIEVIRDKNEGVPDDQKDRVCIVTFDVAGAAGAKVVQALTYDYSAAQQACTTLQPVQDNVASNNMEVGIQKCRTELAPPSEGGNGRTYSTKIIVPLTDGVPNLYVSTTSTINAYSSGFATSHPGETSEFVGGGYYWLDAPIMQTYLAEADDYQVYPVGLGAGADYDFLDRLTRAAGTGTAAPRNSGDPAEYEMRTKEIFEDILRNARVRLVR